MACIPAHCSTELNTQSTVNVALQDGFNFAQSLVEYKYEWETGTTYNFGIQTSAQHIYTTVGTKNLEVIAENELGIKTQTVQVGSFSIVKNKK